MAAPLASKRVVITLRIHVVCPTQRASAAATSPAEAIVRLLRCVGDVKNAPPAAAPGRWRAVEKQRPHGENIPRPCDARNECGERDTRSVGADYAGSMTTREHEERSGFGLGRIEMKYAGPATGREWLGWVRPRRLQKPAPIASVTSPSPASRSLSPGRARRARRAQRERSPWTQASTQAS
jgi:hypothetical protein